MASASSTTAFFILFFLLASPFPPAAAHGPREDAYPPVPEATYPTSPENAYPPTEGKPRTCASEPLVDSLHKLQSGLSELTDLAKQCNFEETAVHAVHEALRLVSEMEPLLCQDFKTVESYFLPIVSKLTGELLHLLDSLPSEVKAKKSALSSTVFHVVEYLVCKVELIGF